MRAAIAAVLAWSVVVPFGGVANDYPYYAPFGAVVVVSTTVMGSIRASGQALFALSVGVLLGAGVQFLELPGVLAIGLLVGFGTLLSRLPQMGAMGSWAPTSGLFVLILGHGDPGGTFVLGYVGLTTVGAVIGGAVSLAFPPLPHVEVEQVLVSLRSATAEALDGIATALENDAPPGERLQTVTKALSRRGRIVEDAVAEGLVGPPVNWRAVRWRHRGRRLATDATRWARLASAVVGLTNILWHDATSAGPFNPEDLGAPAAGALRSTATALRAEPAKTDSIFEEAKSKVEALTDRVRRTTDPQESGLFAAGALALVLDMAIAAIQGGTTTTGQTSTPTQPALGYQERTTDAYSKSSTLTSRPEPGSYQGSHSQ